MSTESTATVTVHKSVTVSLEPARAFELFTTRMTDFWPAEHSIGSAAIAEVVVEAAEGGRWYERGVDGSECPWGRVVAWEPPGRLVLLWQIDGNWQFDPAFETEVEVTFTADSPGHTRLDLNHRHLQRYGDAVETLRGVFDSPGGWQGTLDRFAALAS